jgi:spore coat protein A, manganese oxidase
MKPLNPYNIPKYINQLTILPVFKPIILKDPSTGHFIGHGYRVHINALYQQYLPPGFPKTKVWGFGGMVETPGIQRSFYYQSGPGPTFETIRGIPAYVNWINELTGPHILPVDPTLHWANPNNMPPPQPPFAPFPPGYSWAQQPIPVVIHLHGGETPSAYDGHPEAWYTADGRTGQAYITMNYIYPNTQQPTALWYHDHTLGITRLGIYSGLAGMYLIRDPRDPIAEYLPGSENEITLVIQDRSFNSDGSLLYSQIGDVPSIHPYWVPDFFAIPLWSMERSGQI